MYRRSRRELSSIVEITIFFFSVKTIIRKSRAITSAPISIAFPSIKAFPRGSNGTGDKEQTRSVSRTVDSANSFFPAEHGRVQSTVHGLFVRACSSGV